MAQTPYPYTLHCQKQSITNCTYHSHTCFPALTLRRKLASVSILSILRMVSSSGLTTRSCIFGAMKLILATCTIRSSTTSSSPAAEADLLDHPSRACSCAHAGKNTPSGGGRGGGDAWALPREN